jgi:phosphate starvation-inducible protein PhoH
MMDYRTKMVLIDALWGTSKTYLAVLSALNLLNSGTINKIYYVRSPIESSDTAKIGLLPGDLSEKTASYMAVMEEKLAEFLPYNQVNRLIQEEYVEFLPPGFMRGRSLDNAVLICDESSNFSWKDLLLISSRLGANSKMFVVGDSFQNDIGNKSGFERFFNLFHNDEDSKTNGIHTFTMKNKEDILRSGFIRFVMEKAGVLLFGK